MFHGINSEKAIIIIVSKHKKEASSIEVKLIHDSSSANAAIQYGPIKWRGLTDISTANFYDTNNTTRVFFVEVFLGNSIAIKKTKPVFQKQRIMDTSNRRLWIYLHCLEHGRVSQNMECQLKLRFLTIKPCNVDQIQMGVKVWRKAPQLTIMLVTSTLRALARAYVFCNCIYVIFGKKEE